MILRPQYTQRPVEILLAGTANSGKRTLANQLIQCRHTYITTSTIEKFKTEYLRKIKSCDYVLILVDLLNRQSLQGLQETLGKIDPAYLVSQCAIVITKVDAPVAWMMGEDEVQDIIDLYAPDIYVFRANLTDEKDRRILCDRIARIVGTSALQQKGVTTALVRSAVYYNQIPYSARSIDEQTPDHDQDGDGRVLTGEKQEAGGTATGSDNKDEHEDAMSEDQQEETNSRSQQEDVQDEAQEDTKGEIEDVDEESGKDKDAKETSDAEEEDGQATAQ